MALTNGSDSEHLTPDALEELRRLARSRPKDGRGRLAKLGALRTLERLERLEREARRRKPQPPPLPFLELSIGPTDGFGPTAKELEAMWPAVRELVLESYRDPVYAGRRPWAWWRERDEESVWDGRWVSRHDEAVRLAELGLLEAWERAELKKAADDARPRIGTDREHIYFPKGSGSVEQDAVRLWDAVQDAAHKTGGE
jgi:hypothetical protein